MKAKDKLGNDDVWDVLPRLLPLSLYREKIDRTRDACNSTPQLKLVKPELTLNEGPVNSEEVSEPAPNAQRLLSIGRPLKVEIPAIAEEANNWAIGGCLRTVDSTISHQKWENAHITFCFYTCRAGGQNMGECTKRALQIVVEQICISMFDADETVRLLLNIARVSRACRIIVIGSGGLRRLAHRLNPCDICSYHSKQFISLRTESNSVSHLLSTPEWLVLRRCLVLKMLGRQPVRLFTTLQSHRASGEASKQDILNVVYRASVIFNQSMGVSRYDSHSHGHDEVHEQMSSLPPSPTRATKLSLRWLLLNRKQIHPSLSHNSHWRSVVTALAEAVCFNPAELIMQEDVTLKEDQLTRDNSFFILMGSDSLAFPELNERCRGSISSLAAVHMHHDHAAGRDKALVCLMHGQLVRYLVDNAFFKAPPPPPSFITRLWHRMGWGKKNTDRQQR